MWSSRLGQAERNMRHIKMHTKIWSESLKKVGDDIEMKFKWQALSVFCENKFGLCNKITSWPSALPTLQYDPGRWSHAVGQESLGMPFLRLVCPAPWLGVLVCAAKKQTTQRRWDSQFLTTRNAFRRSSVFSFHLNSVQTFFVDVVVKQIVALFKC
jgi:hypothetical protein